MTRAERKRIDSRWRRTERRLRKCYEHEAKQRQDRALIRAAITLHANTEGQS